MIELFGYFSALLIGLALGLMGGGGSILTVPVLVYLMSFSPVMATAYSLFVVGATSLAGSVSYYRQGLVRLETAALFGAPSVLMVFLTRKYIIPAIPQDVFSIGSFTVSKDMLLMVLFAALMIFASVGMIRGKKKVENKTQKTPEPWMKYGAILLEGSVVGLLTGLVGAGGGFLIVPALVLFSKLDMKTAVGTSLVIISAKSLFGFLGDVSNYDIEWGFLMSFTALSIVGIIIGTKLSKKVPGPKLKKWFGWFVLVMGVYIMLKELMA